MLRKERELQLKRQSITQPDLEGRGKDSEQKYTFVSRISLVFAGPDNMQLDDSHLVNNADLEFELVVDLSGPSLTNA